MIANEKRKELIDDRLDSLQLMHALLNKHPVPVDALKEVGRMAKYARDVIEACDREGWDKYYEISARLRV